MIEVTGLLEQQNTRVYRRIIANEGPDFEKPKGKPTPVYRLVVRLLGTLTHCASDYTIKRAIRT
jgi:hypothetical protein